MSSLLPRAIGSDYKFASFVSFLSSSLSSLHSYLTTLSSYQTLNHITYFNLTLDPSLLTFISTMRSNLLFVLFALLCAAFVAANPDAEPEAEPGRGGAQCGGRVIGSCQRGFSCTKNKSNKYFCKAM